MSTEKRTSFIKIRTTPETYAKIKQYAHKTGQTFTAVVEYAVLDMIEPNQKKGDSTK